MFPGRQPPAQASALQEEAAPAGPVRGGILLQEPAQEEAGHFRRPGPALAVQAPPGALGIQEPEAAGGEAQALRLDLPGAEGAEQDVEEKQPATAPVQDRDAAVAGRPGGGPGLLQPGSRLLGGEEKEQRRKQHAGSYRRGFPHSSEPMRRPLPLLVLVLILAGLGLLLGPWDGTEPESAASPSLSGAASPAREAVAAPAPEGGPERQNAALLRLTALDAEGGVLAPARFLLEEADGTLRIAEAPEGHLERPAGRRPRRAAALAAGRWSAPAVPGEGTEVLLRTDRPAALLEVRVDRSELPGEPYAWRLDFAGPLPGGGEEALALGRMLSLLHGGWQESREEILRIPDLAPGLWTLRLRSERAAPARGSVRLEGPGPAVLELRLRAGGFVAGRVGDEEGRPVADAVVGVLPDASLLPRLLQVAGDEADPFGLLERLPGGTVTRSDPRGAFRAGPLAPGDYQVVVLARGFEPRTLPRLVRVEAGGTTVAAVPPLRPARFLELQVLDETTGAPLTQALVDWRPLAEGGPTLAALWPWAHGGATDAEGRCRLGPLPGPRLELRVRAAGHAEHRERLDGLPPGPHVVRLLPGLQLSGRVLAGAEGEPVAGARVAARPARTAFDLLGAWTREAGTGPETRSAEDGTFTLDGLGPGLWEVTAEAEGFAPARSEVLDLLPGAPPAPLLLRLGRGGALRILVQDEEGRPRAGDAVSVFGLENRESRAGQTGEDGALLFENLPPGRYTVTCFQTGTSGFEGFLSGELAGMATDSAFVEVAEGERAEVLLGGLRPRTLLRGFVTRGGQPAPGLTAMLTSGAAFLSASTDQDGYYEIDGVPEGTWLLSVGEVNLGGGSAWTTTVELRGEAVRDLDVELPAHGLRVRVLDAVTGDPLSGMPVLVRPPGNVQGAGYRNTGADGVAEFPYLEAGTWVVTAGPGALPLLGSQGDWSTETLHGLHLGPESSGFTEVELRLRPPAQLEVRVLDLQGRPLSGAGVFYLDAEGQPVSLVALQATDADGRLLLEHLPPGPGEVLARHPAAGEARRKVELAPGATAEVELRLDPGTLVTVLVLDREGRPARGVQALLLDEHGAPVSALWTGMQAMAASLDYLQGGEQRLGPVGPGDYTLLLTRPGGPASREPLRLSPGQPELRLSRSWPPEPSD